MKHGRLTYIGGVVALASTWLATTICAHASVIVDATFTGNSGSPGTVTLQIDLPDNANNNTTAATAVYITSATIPLPGPTPFNTIGSEFSNSFTLSGGMLTAYGYGSELISGSTLVYGLQFTSDGDILQTTGGVVYNSNSRLFVVNSITFPTVSVPEPDSIALLGAGLLGLGFITARRRLRAAPCPPV